MALTVTTTGEASLGANGLSPRETKESRCAANESQAGMNFEKEPSSLRGEVWRDNAIVPPMGYGATPRKKKMIDAYALDPAPSAHGMTRLDFHPSALILHPCLSPSNDSLTRILHRFASPTYIIAPSPALALQGFARPLAPLKVIFCLSTTPGDRGYPP